MTHISAFIQVLWALVVLLVAHVGAIDPTSEPTSIPTTLPSIIPSTMPSSMPTAEPSGEPSGQPSGEPTSFPTTGTPTSQPTGEPSGEPSRQPTGDPTSIPSSRPTAVFETHTIFGAVGLNDVNAGFCVPLAINISIGFDQPIGYVGQEFRVGAPGLTSGPCKTPTDGANLTSLVLRDSDWFTAQFVEGSWRNYYEDSYFRLELVQAPLVPGQLITVLVDRSNRIRRNCMRLPSWSVLEQRTQGDFGSIGKLPITSYNKDSFSQCYAYSSQLTFFPHFQKFPIEVSLSLTLAFKLTPGDTITLYLPGFTNSGRYLSNIPRTIVSTAAGDTNLSAVSWSTDFNWTNTWHEGNLHSAPSHAESFVTFTRKDRHYVYPNAVSRFPQHNEPFQLNISRRSQLSAYCGQRANYEGFAFSVRAALYNISKTPIMLTDGIGPGCTAQNDCSGNGVCDFCTSTCQCFDGFGSPQDLSMAVTNNFNADCSSRTCPRGPAVRNGGKDSLSAVTMHRTMECSNNGNCDRITGTCSCFGGYSGAACERMDCPTSTMGVCSNRGVCLPQSTLPIRSDALPLTNSTTHRYVATSGDSGSAWDGNFGRACVCDSSWEVGLGAGQTQLAEYFGPACEYRRCPSGDDPLTAVDETDCDGKVQTEGGGEGGEGNKCHLDCSGRGTCDYSTGICSCFAGFGMHNCGTRM